MKKNFFFYKYVEEILSYDEEEKIEDQEIESNIVINSIKEQSGFLEVTFELYRGDTNKRTVYILNNNKQQHSIEIPTKYTKIKSKLLIQLQPGENTLTFSGIDIEKELTHFSEKEKLVIQDTSLEKSPIKEIHFFNITLKDLQVIRPLYISTKLNLTCNVYQKNTKIAGEYVSQINSGFYIVEQKFNQSKIKKEINQTIVELKHSCKYKPTHLKSYSYASIFFNLSLENNTIKILENKFISTIDHIQTNQTLHLEKNEEKIQYHSEQKKFKENSNLPLLGAMSMLLIGFVLIW